MSKVDFSFSKISKTFDKHINGQLFWHKDFVNNFLPEFASFFMRKNSIVYDFGASTGNVELAISDKIKERAIEFIPVEKCKEMLKLYKGEKNRLVISDFLEITIKYFSFATSILSLCFVHPSQRGAFIDTLKSKCEKGGAILILEKMVAKGGCLGSVLNRITWRNKLDQGESIKNVIYKELSLSGVQYPLSECELEGFDLIWAYGDFRSYIWVNNR